MLAILAANPFWKYVLQSLPGEALSTTIHHRRRTRTLQSTRKVRKDWPLNRQGYFASFGAATGFAGEIGAGTCRQPAER
jgi:hypothetical protein